MWHKYLCFLNNCTRCVLVWHDLFSCIHFLMILLQNALVKGAVKELASLHGTKYTYGPGASTICESWVQNFAKKPPV